MGQFKYIVPRILSERELNRKKKTTASQYIETIRFQITYIWMQCPTQAAREVSKTHSEAAVMAWWQGRARAAGTRVCGTRVAMT